MALVRFDHVQLAMPPGGEEEARRFYSGILKMEEIPKPAELARRGGCWFRAGELNLHLGVEEDFRAVKKAHPAIVVADLASLAESLASSGVEVEEIPLEGYRRVYVSDPFGNRIELMEPTATL